MTIDGKNLLSTWGITLLDGSFGNLFKYPKRKTVQYSNYAERDGITPDLRKIEYEPKNVTLDFMMKHSSVDEFWDKYSRFFTEMTTVGYRSMDLENGLIHTLRYDKTSRYESPRLFNAGPSATSFALNFIEDKNAIPQIESPTGGINLRGSYEINGMDFGLFGVHPDGEIGEMLKYPNIKTPFTNGREYDLETRRLMHKEITIPLWMVAESKDEFITNYSAFFQQFNKPGKQSLYINEIGGVTYAYYTDCPSYTISWGGRIGAKFSISFVVPVVTWLDGTTTILTVLQDPDLGILSNEEGKILTLNR